MIALQENIINSLQTFWEALNDKGLISIALLGSNTIEYIHLKRDIDVVFVIDKRENMHNIIKALRENEELTQIKKQLKQEYNVSIILEDLPYVQQLHIFSYESNETLFGESIEFFRDVFSYSTEYIALCKNVVKEAKERLQIAGYYHKNLYHVLTIIYFLSNNLYELTEKQITNINIVHDGNDNDSISRILDFIEEWLSSYEVTE